MSGGSELGAWAIVDGLEKLLKSRLQEYVDDVTRKANVRFKLFAPSTLNGYARTPTHVPRDRANSISIWVDRRQPILNVMNKDGPRTEQVVIGILWLLHDADPNIMEQKKQLATQAMTTLIWRRWRADLQDAKIHNLTFEPIDFRFSSLRMRGGSTKGLKGYNVDTGDNVDGAIVGVQCMQRVHAPVDFE